MRYLNSLPKMTGDHGGDVVKVERKTPAYYTGQVIQQEKSQR